MKISIEDKTFREITSQRLPTSSRLNLYNILKDTENDVYFGNIFRFFEITSDIKNNNSYFDIYIALEDEWWDNISYTFYDTPQLWYLVCSMNDIINPYEELEPGQQIKVLKREYLYDAFKGIKNTSEL